MIIEVINKYEAKLIQADKEDIKNINKHLVASKYVPRKGGGFVTSESGIENMLIIPTTLLRRLRGVPNVKIINGGILHNPIPKDKMIAALEAFGLEYPMHYWQSHTLNLMLSMPFGQYVLSMNAGKSYINYLYSLLRAMKGKKTVIVVPRLTLATQMFKDFVGHASFLTPQALEMLGGTYDVDCIYHGSRRVNSNIIIANSASLGIMSERDKDGNLVNPQYKEFFDSVDYIIFDECHSMVGAEHYKTDSDYLKFYKVCNNTKGRYGYTGTEHSDPIKALLTDKYLGCIMYTVNAVELEEAGQSATPNYISNVILTTNEQSQLFYRKLDEYQKKVESGCVARCVDYKGFISTLPNTVKTINIYENKYWITAPHTKYLLGIEKSLEGRENLKRYDYKILSYTETVAFNYSKLYWGGNSLFRDTVINNVLSHPPTENQLIFVDNLKDLHKLRDILLEKGREVVMFYGDLSADERMDIMKRMETEDGLIMVAMYHVMAVGVSIKKIHRMHLYSSCKEAIRFMQSFGRIIRKHPDIPIVFVHDWAIKLLPKDKDAKKNKYGYLFEHLKERLKTLNTRLGYTHTTITINQTPK